MTNKHECNNIYFDGEPDKRYLVFMYYKYEANGIVDKYKKEPLPYDYFSVYDRLVGKEIDTRKIGA